MIINCFEDYMTLFPGNGVCIDLDLEIVKEIIKIYNDYYVDGDDEDDN